MRLESPSWWYGARTPALAWGLAPISALYGAIAGRRLKAPPSYRSALPVICIGNFTMGGAGKTPVALKIASLLRGRGLTPGFLTRGFGGAERGPRLVDARADDASAVGDEALLLAQAEKTVVSRVRPPGAKLLESLAVDVIVMDDGFQNPSLHKDFSLVVIDGGAGIGSGHVFPLGPLRAPLRLQVEKADAILILGSGLTDPSRYLGKLGSAPILRAEAAPVLQDGLDGRRFIAYSGIGRPQKFFDTLDKARIQVVDRLSFPDHYLYTEADARRLLSAAKKAGAGLIATEKDHVRLAGAAGSLAELYERTMKLPITVRFHENGEAQLMSILERALAGRLPAHTARHE